MEKRILMTKRKYLQEISNKGEGKSKRKRKRQRQRSGRGGE